MNKELDESYLNNVDYETQDETNLKAPDEEPFWIKNEFVNSLLGFIFVMFLILVSPYIVPFLFCGSIDIYEYITFDPVMFEVLKINITQTERSEIQNKMKFICNILSMPQANLEYFLPLFDKKSTSIQKNLLPLNKISFIVSANPSSLFNSKLRVDIWSTEFGSSIVKDTGIQPLKTVYCDAKEAKSENFTSPIEFSKNCKVKLIDEVNKINILTDNFHNVPSNVEWFIIIDDKTLPFVDRIDLMLSKYANPLKNDYLIRGPKNKNKTRSSSSGMTYILSRKLAEKIVQNQNKCENGILKCIRSITDISPIIDNGFLKLDPLVIKGDLSGLIENYVERLNLKSIQNIENDFYLFPKQFLNMMKENYQFNVKIGSDKKNLSFNSFPIPGRNFFSQEAHFANSAAVTRELFLKRYIIMFTKNDRFYFGVLNMGYSFLVFNIEYKLYQHYELVKEIMKYISGVEKTFEIIPDELYYNLTRLLMPQCKKLFRYYLKRTLQYKFGDNAFRQEFCGVSSPSTMAKIYVNNQKVKLDYLDYSMFKD